MPVHSAWFCHKITFLKEISDFIKSFLVSCGAGYEAASPTNFNSRVAFMARMHEYFCVYIKSNNVPGSVIYTVCRFGQKNRDDLVGSVCSWFLVHLVNPFIHRISSMQTRFGARFGGPAADQLYVMMKALNPCRQRFFYSYHISNVGEKRNLRWEENDWICQVFYNKSDSGFDLKPFRLLAYSASKTTQFIVKKLVNTRLLFLILSKCRHRISEAFIKSKNLAKNTKFTWKFPRW